MSSVGRRGAAGIRGRAKANSRRIEQQKEEERQKLEEERRRLEEEDRRRREAVEHARIQREKELHRIEQEKRQREKIRERLRQISLCPMGFNWRRQRSGWRCGGGSHYVSDAELQRSFPTTCTAMPMYTSLNVKSHLLFSWGAQRWPSRYTA